MHGSSGVIAWRFDPSLEITGRELMAPLGVFVVSLIVVSRYLHLYSPARIGGYLHEQRLTVQACLTAGLLVIGMMYLTHILEVPRSLLLIMLALVTSLLGLRVRPSLCLGKAPSLRAANRHILVVGSLPEAAAVNNTSTPFAISGFWPRGSSPSPAPRSRSAKRNSAASLNKRAPNSLTKSFSSIP